jgi:hypothetical protein
LTVAAGLALDAAALAADCDVLAGVFLATVFFVLTVGVLG